MVQIFTASQKVAFKLIEQEKEEIQSFLEKEKQNDSILTKIEIQIEFLNRTLENLQESETDLVQSMIDSLLDKKLEVTTAKYNAIANVESHKKILEAMKLAYEDYR